MKRIVLFLTFLILFMPLALIGDTVQCSDSINKRGCCSWHGGVCGCDEESGMQLCCDDTLSPTCECGE